VQRALERLEPVAQLAQLPDDVRRGPRVQLLGHFLRLLLDLGLRKRCAIAPVRSATKPIPTSMTTTARILAPVVVGEGSP
jgi:hypothetical protein